MRSELESSDKRVRASGLRVVSNAEEHQPININLEMKAVLDDMKRRYRVMHEQHESVSDAPDAA